MSEMSHYTRKFPFFLNGNISPEENDEFEQMHAVQIHLVAMATKRLKDPDLLASWMENQRSSWNTLLSDHLLRNTPASSYEGKANDA